MGGWLHIHGYPLAMALFAAREKWLIPSNLIKCKQNKEEVIIVDGIRQPFILDQLNKIHPGEIHWLEVPVKEREKRYVKRNAKKDTQSFKDADNHPIELECQQIYRIFKNKLKIINN